VEQESGVGEVEEDRHGAVAIEPESEVGLKSGAGEQGGRKGAGKRGEGSVGAGVGGVQQESGVGEVEENSQGVQATEPKSGEGLKSGVGDTINYY